jgi:hypothetical protein
MEASTSPNFNDDRLRVGACVMVVLVALLTGYVLGLAGGPPTSGSRVAWPKAPSNPRSFNP